MELLGAAEERKLFSADTMAAIMHWPAGYSVDAADWVTESNEAFARPVTPFSRQPLHDSRDTAGEDSVTHRVVAPASVNALNGDSGLFTEVLFPRRLQRGRISCAKRRESTPLRGGSIQNPPMCDSQGPSQGPQQNQNERPQRETQRRLLDRNVERHRAANSGSIPVQSSGVSRNQRYNPLPSYHYGNAVTSLQADRRGDERMARRASSQPQRHQHKETLDTLRDRHNPDHNQTETSQAVCSTKDSQQQQQQLLQRQRELLWEQFDQVDKMRMQLEELENMISTLQLQSSGSHEPGPVRSSQQPSRNLNVLDLQSPAYEEDGDDDDLGWSLDPRDYKQMPADFMDWIPPAGLPSVRTSVSQAPIDT